METNMGTPFSAIEVRKVYIRNMFVWPEPGPKYEWLVREEDGALLQTGRNMNVDDLNPVIMEVLARYAPPGTDERLIPAILVPYLYVNPAPYSFYLDIKEYKIDGKDIVMNFDFFVDLFYNLASVFGEVHIIIEMVYSMGDIEW